MKSRGVLLLSLLLLAGCDQRTVQEKSFERISQYLSANSESGAYCFYLGDIELPYSSVISPQIEENRLKIWLNDELDRRLNLFTQLALLQKTELDGKKEYSLTELGRNSYRNKKFCFGNIELETINTDLNTTTSRYSRASIGYKITNIPLWAKSDLFIDYFYRYNDEDNGLKAYPLLDDTTRTTIIPLERDKKEDYFNINWISFNGLSASWAYDLADPEKKSKLITEPYSTMPAAGFNFAYYDFELAKKIFSDSASKNELITYWGEPDPIVYDKKVIPDYIDQANAMILIAGEEYFILSKNKIKSIKTYVFSPSEYGYVGSANANLEIKLNSNGGLDKYAIFVNAENIVNADYTKERVVDYNTGKLLWRFKYNGNINNYYFNSSSSNYIDYKLDSTGQIVAISSKEEPNLNANFIPLFDKQKRLVQYGDIKLVYKDNLLSERIGLDKKTVFSYNKKNQLNKMVDYKLTNGKYVKDYVCIFTDYNQQGDWTRLQCDAINKSYRQITYFDNE